MHYYILNGVIERRERLENHLSQTGVLDNFDVHWVTDFKKDHPFVEFIHDFYAEHVSVEGLSGFVKFCKILQMGLETGDSHFMVSDDDVVFVKDWKDHFDKMHFGFINVIGLGVNFHILPDGKPKFTGNIGGCECNVVSRDFAKFFLDNIDFRQAPDIVVSAMIMHNKLPLVVTPICQQTSFLENKSSLSHNSTKYEIDWITFVNTYKPSGINYDHIKKEFDLYIHMRKIVEDDFNERFGIQIPIYNKRYIIERFKALRQN